jgi:hypothetical protein
MHARRCSFSLATALCIYFVFQIGSCANYSQAGLSDHNPPTEYLGLRVRTIVPGS